MKIGDKIQKLFKVVIFIIVLLPLMLYIITFHSYQLSPDPSDWSDFGSYIGGVYSIIVGVYVVYLARALSRKDEIICKRKAAIEEIYKQIAVINPKKISVKSVNKIFKVLDSNKLYITDKTYYKIQELANHYLEVKGKFVDFDKGLDLSVKQMLKDNYEA